MNLFHFCLQIVIKCCQSLNLDFFLKTLFLLYEWDSIIQAEKCEKWSKCGSLPPDTGKLDRAEVSDVIKSIWLISSAIMFAKLYHQVARPQGVSRQQSITYRYHLSGLSAITQRHHGYSQLWQSTQSLSLESLQIRSLICLYYLHDLIDAE